MDEIKPASRRNGSDRLDQLVPAGIQSILAEFRDILLDRLSGHVRRLILFGSWARGDAAPDSDFDVAVIITGHDERWAYWSVPTAGDGILDLTGARLGCRSLNESHG